MKTIKAYHAQIPSDSRDLCSIVEDIILFIKEYIGVLPEDYLFEVKVILNELIINAMKHGNKGDKNKLVNIITGLSEMDHIYIIIEDQGEGCDYEYFLNRRCCLEDMSESCSLQETGRGIFIVKSLCDRLKFNKRGNKVIVLKKINRGD